MSKFFTKKSLIILICSIFFICIQAFIGIIEADFIQALAQRAAMPNVTTATSNLISDPNVRALFNLGITNLSLLFVSIIFFSMICGVIGVILSAKAISMYVANIRYKTYEKIQSFSYQDIDNFSAPSLITRTTTDAEIANISLSFAARFLTNGIFTFTFGLVKSLINYQDFSIVYAALLPFLFVFLFVVVWRAIPYFKDAQKNTDAINNVVRDTILGIRVVKAYNLEKTQSQKFEEANTNLATTSLKAFTIVGILMPIIQAAVSSTMIIIYFIAFNTGNTESFFSIIGFSSILMQVLFGFIISIVTFVQISRSIPSIKRILEVNNFKPSLTFDENSNSKIEEGSIVFDNVSYFFSENAQHPVLKNINLEIKPKEKVGIVGATGSGKSTLINLIGRLFDPTEGSVFIDGVPVNKFSFNEINTNVSIAMQTATLFSGTIESNIAMGLPADLSDEKRKEEVETAAKAAEAWEFISKKEDGLSSVVEQRGKNFSGGQKQRISIARTISKKSKVLIFDDSTSALDIITEQKVQANIRDYNDCTTIIVAQRIASVENLDKIIVMDKGEIVGFDSHWNLLESNDIYRSIAASQLGTEELNEILAEKGVRQIEK